MIYTCTTPSHIHTSSFSSSPYIIICLYNPSIPPAYFNGEDKEVWGARGEGCQSNYGEYMIELEEYLAIMLEWQAERYQEYVEYCEDCMMQVYKKWMNSYHGRELTYEEWKVSEHAENPRNLAYHYNDDAQYANINYVCEEYDTCREYNQLNEEDEFSEYFECTEVERNNGQVAYVGPTCGADGYDITLGVYTDENCDVYIGDGVDVSNFVGQEVTEGTLKNYYDSAWGATLAQLEYVNDDQVCIPCKNSVSFLDLLYCVVNFQVLLLTLHTISLIYIYSSGSDVGRRYVEHER